MNIRPLADRIVLKRHDAENISHGGIILPDAAKDKSMYATVIAVGPGKVLENGRRLEPSVQPGDTVIAVLFDEMEEFDGFVVVQEDEILGVVTL
jgi:chaperonin GroES